MSRWEYRKIALNEIAHRGDDIDVLCDVGSDGWELVAVLPNSVAYLKRLVPAADTKGQPVEEAPVQVVRRVDAADSRPPSGPEARVEARPKYRDPETNDTWTGRGRMPNWLKRKQEAGEDIEEYLV